MRFCQLNIAKRKNAWDNLCQDISKSSKSTIFMITEPYLISKTGKVPKLPQGYLSYGENFSRGIIIAHKSLELWFTPEFTSLDCTTCKLVIGKKSWFICSLYLDILKEVIHPTFDKLVNSCNLTGDQLIIGSDTNCHSPMFGSRSTNARGSELEEYLISADLNVENIGNKPTFIRQNCETVIDVTFSKNLTECEISDWHLVNDYKFSDHLMIEFTLNVHVKPEKKTLDLSRCNFEKFKENLPKTSEFVKFWSISRIEREARSIETSIEAAIKRSCPVKKPSKPKVRWWSNDLNDKKVEVKRLAIKAWSTKAIEDWENLKVANKVYTKMIRKAKRQCWQKWCSEIESPKNIALLNKAISRKENKTISLLKHPDGGYTRSPDEVTSILLDHHFPESGPLTVEEIPLEGKTCYAWELSNSFITKMKVKAAFSSFGTGKAGPDLLKPKFLQNLDDKTINRITWLYRACLRLNYTPKNWRNSKCIFIPKIGKDDYTSVKAFRPISLVSFLFKALERVVLWELEANVLSKYPINRNQHAFRRGFSCDTALSDFTDEVESAILRGQYALGCFIDIEGAFSNVSFDSAINAMVSKKFPSDIRNWYTHFLRNRVVSTDVLGIQACRKINKGTGQGLVLSPVIWNLIFDSFLDIFKTGPVKGVGFADDGALLAKGPDLPSVVSLMQQSLKSVENWSKQQKLQLCPTKTVAIIFHRKTKKTFSEPKKLKLFGHTIEYSQSTRYLGVTLDHKLNWKIHIEQKIQKAKRHLMMLKQSLGVRWGPKGKVLKWMYKGIVLPSLTFGSIIWAKACEGKGVKEKLSKLNRLISLLICPMRKSTPSAGLEVLFDFPPIDLVIREAALKSYLRVNVHNRTKWDGLGSGKSFGHLTWCRKIFDSMKVNPSGYDKTAYLNLSRHFRIDMESKKSGLPIADSYTQCFTDGSRLLERAGYGLCIVNGKSIVTKCNGYLGMNATVFQCEVYAIMKAAEILRKFDTLSVTIFTDSQAALNVLGKVRINSIVVKKCIHELNRLGKQKSVVIKWVKAHSGHEFNEVADLEAKSGTRSSVEEEIPPPLTIALRRVESGTRKLWDQRWSISDNCRQTKQWMPLTNKIKASKLVNLDRKSLSLAVHLLSGHNYLRYHESLMDHEVPPYCREGCDSMETGWHVICECPATWKLRAEVFKTYQSLETPLEWSVYQINKIVSNPQVINLLEGRQEQMGT